MCGVTVIQRPLNCLVIDADNTARQHLLAALLEVDHKLQVKPCENATSAQRLLSETAFDVWFLDIDLPGISGFGFLDEQQKCQRHIPPLVFTTAHQDFALRAFDYPVLDYLLKPLKIARVARALDKLQTMSTHHYSMAKTPQQAERPAQINIDTGTERFDANTLVRFKNGSSFLCLRHADILWIEAAGDYMCVHTLTETHILRSTLAQLERQLSHQHFVRVSRSALVNWQNVKGYKAAKNGSYQVQLIDKQQLSVSRKYKIRISEINSL